ncbi:MAG: hypothetical protein AB7O70_07155, partial [Hyphomicrobiales bacterium]
MLGRAGIWAIGAAMVSAAAAAALAQDDGTGTGIKAYFAVPFSGPEDKTASRVGLQLVTTWNDDESTRGRTFEAPRLESAIDLAFSRRGLAKFEVMGADARGTWNAAAEWLGLELNVPEECETTYRCRDQALLLARDSASLGL